MRAGADISTRLKKNRANAQAEEAKRIPGAILGYRGGFLGRLSRAY